MRVPVVLFTETGRPLYHKSPRPRHPVPGVLRPPRWAAIFISVLIALLFMTGCAKRSNSVPGVTLRIGEETPSISVRVEGQETFSQKGTGATLRPFPAQKSQLAIVVRLQFGRPVTPPMGTYIRCGDTFLTPRYQDRVWEFSGEIAPVSECVFGIGENAIGIPTGIQEFRIQVGEREVVISPPETASEPAPLWIEVGGEITRTLNAIVVIRAGREGVRVWGVTEVQPQTLCGGITARVRPLASPGVYEVQFVPPIKEGTCLLFTRHSLLLVFYFRQ